MADAPGRLGFFVWLFGLSTDIAARKAIDIQLKRIGDTAAHIRKDHSLEELAGDIEAIATNGAAAMGADDD